MVDEVRADAITDILQETYDIAADKIDELEDNEDPREVLAVLKEITIKTSAVLGNIDKGYRGQQLLSSVAAVYELLLSYEFIADADFNYAAIANIVNNLENDSDVDVWEVNDVLREIDGVVAVEIKRVENVAQLKDDLEEVRDKTEALIRDINGDDYTDEALLSDLDAIGSLTTNIEINNDDLDFNSDDIQSAINDTEAEITEVEIASAENPTSFDLEQTALSSKNNKEENSKAEDNSELETTIVVKKVSWSINCCYGHPSQAAIEISFRHEQGKRMHGAFFDHYVMRNISGHNTKIRAPASTNFNTFNKFINTDTTLALGVGDNLGEREIPEVFDNKAPPQGLLFIPGNARDDDYEREQYENELLKRAKLYGQPVLTICGGSWKLYKFFGGVVNTVTDHCYSSMPYIVSNGGIGNNVQVHRIMFNPNTMVKSAMSLWSNKTYTPSQFPKVNSVHWKVPDITNVPGDLEISALSVPGEWSVNGRQGKMNSEAGTVEAFETKFGAPMVGVLWHLEAYFSNKDYSYEDERHLNLIKYMAIAGDAFGAKQNMLKEFKQKYSSSTLLASQGIFKLQSDVPNNKVNQNQNVLI